MSPGSDFNRYPLTFSSTLELFEKVIIPLLRGISLTLKVKEKAGGYALVKFMVENINSLLEYKGLPAESPLFVEIDSRVFNDDVWENLRDQISSLTGLVSELKCRDKSMDSDYVLLKSLITEVTKRQPIVIIIRGVNYLVGTDSIFWKKVRALRSDGFSLRFLFVIYESAPLKVTDERFDPIRDLLEGVEVEIGAMNDKDLIHSILRWGEVYHRKWTASEIEAIKTLSSGYCSIVKECCVKLLGYSGSNPYEYLLSKVRILNHASVPCSKLALDISQTQIKIFTQQEKVLCSLLIDSTSPLPKETIALHLWGSDYLNKYSESSIFRLISRLRKKLSSLTSNTLIIKNIYGKGYVIERRG